MVQQTLEQIAHDPPYSMGQSGLSPTDKALETLRAYRGHIQEAEGLGYGSSVVQLANEAIRFIGTARETIGTASEAAGELSELLNFYATIEPAMLKPRRGRGAKPGEGEPQAGGNTTQPHGVVPYKNAWKQLNLSPGMFRKLTRVGALHAVGDKQVSAESLQEFVDFMQGKEYVSQLQQTLAAGNNGASSAAVEGKYGQNAAEPKRQKRTSSQRANAGRNWRQSSNGGNASSPEEVVVNEATEEFELSGGNSLDAFTQFMKYARSIPLLSKKQEQGLLAQVKVGDEQALNSVVEANYRLVAKWARELYNRFGLKSWSSLELMDLVQEGAIGLHKAAHAYKAEEALERGRKEPYKFSTYASWWIQQSITRAVEDTGRTIRLPVHVQAQIRKIKAASAKLQASMVEPSLEELAKATGFQKEEVSRLLQSSTRTVSLYQPINDEEGDGSTLLDIIPDASGDGNVEEAATSNLVKRPLMAALRQFLDSRQLRLVAARFGLYDGRQKTREEVGLELGVSRETVRHIEREALSKLESSALFCAQFKGIVA